MIARTRDDASGEPCGACEEQASTGESTDGEVYAAAVRWLRSGWRALGRICRVDPKPPAGRWIHSIGTGVAGSSNRGEPMYR